VKQLFKKNAVSSSKTETNAAYLRYVAFFSPSYYF
jgi:hypothetical protein